MLVKPIVSYKNPDLEPLVTAANTQSQQSQVEEQPEPIPEPTFAYPIEETIGVIPTTGTFDDFTNLQQIGFSATRTANNTTSIQNQFDDYQVIKSQNPGHLAGNMDFNIQFLQAYSTPTMSAAAYESWQAYNNWVLGVEDIRSSWDLNGETIYQKWDGTVLDFRGYKGWHIHEKASTFNAVIYP